MADSRDVKRCVGLEIKNKARGEFRAVFATFNSLDSDRDVTLPGAFEEGETVPVSAYGHTSWDGALPVGVSTLHNETNVAVADGRFFLDTDAGRNTFTTVKRLHDEGLGEWSYGYTPLDYYFGEFNGEKGVRFLRKQQVHEISPVLQGAGVGTRTLEAKNKTTRDDRSTSAAAIRSHETDVVERWDQLKVLAGIPLSASVSDLRSMFAWVNPGGDPEQKESYQVPHHLGINGPASLRACLVAVAQLNSGRVSLPDSDRKAVYEHLADHLRDADREPPALLPVGAAGQTKFSDHGLIVLSDLAEFRSRAAEVVALRARKGRGRNLSGTSEEVLGWIAEELREIQGIIDTPADDVAREQARFLAITSRHVHTGE
jgi:hypothetical protein